MRTPLLLVGIALSQMGASNCGGDAVKDPGFDLWCGDTLCAWTLERGHIDRVPTWHEGDSGVSLGDDTAISQLSAFNSGDGTCLQFQFVANVSDDAEVYLNVDLEGDGTNEMHERIPTSHWAPLTYAVALPTPFDGSRFELVKTGGGTAVLAQMGITRVDASVCTGHSTLDPGPRPEGGACLAANQCATGDACSASPQPVSVNQWLVGVCNECDANTPCSGADICGVADPGSAILAFARACVAKASRAVGEACLSDAECGTNICKQAGDAMGVCSSCRFTCGSGQSCRAAWTDGPDTCANGQPGDACASDDDCASGACHGPIRAQCGDGRPCTTRAECPVESDLTPGACTTVGIQGGTCQ